MTPLADDAGVVAQQQTNKTVYHPTIFKNDQEQQTKPNQTT
jgi:hypothetical protein